MKITKPSLHSPKKSAKNVIMEADLHNKKTELNPSFVPTLSPYQPKAPYPARLNTQLRDATYQKFMDLLDKVHVNIPFIEVVSKMPQYAKFMKEILTYKRKLGDVASVVLNEECFAIILNKSLPEKLKDPGSFTLPCIIGKLEVERSLGYLGASINVMPFCLYQKLGLGELSSTKMTIQLADKFTCHPRGILEDLLVKAGPFVFPTDFVIMDTDETDVSLILASHHITFVTHCLASHHTKT
ncbi:unnamed protein product [Linum trigynum]|uniref:Uncharacterized protein n=1 Tax=Linum trigynum TaxID=586398 RepID=A0AAV2GLQ5_9ROSI